MNFQIKRTNNLIISLDGNFFFIYVEWTPLLNKYSLYAVELIDYKERLNWYASFNPKLKEGLRLGEPKPSKFNRECEYEENYFLNRNPQCNNLKGEPKLIYTSCLPVTFIFSAGFIFDGQLDTEYSFSEFEYSETFDHEFEILIYYMMLCSPNRNQMIREVNKALTNSNLTDLEREKILIGYPNINKSEFLRILRACNQRSGELNLHQQEVLPIALFTKKMVNGQADVCFNLKLINEKLGLDKVDGFDINNKKNKNKINIIRQCLVDRLEHKLSHFTREKTGLDPANVKTLLGESIKFDLNLVTFTEPYIKLAKHLNCFDEIYKIKESTNKKQAIEIYKNHPHSLQRTLSSYGVRRRIDERNFDVGIRSERFNKFLK